MKYSLFALFALLVVTSCTPKGDPAKSKQQVLRDAKWRLDTGFVRTITKADGGTTPVDLDNEVPITRSECAYDDELVFREAAEGAHIPGEMTCSINETAELAFRWGITNDDKKMFIYDATEFFKADVNADILEFYDDKFAIRYYVFKDKEVIIGDNPAAWVRDTTIYTMYFKKK